MLRLARIRILKASPHGRGGSGKEKEAVGINEEHGRHEAFTWPGQTPHWAVQLHQMIQRVLDNQSRMLNNEEFTMALTDDLKTQISTLQAEDGVIVTALNDLKAKAVGGTVADTDVQTAIDQIKAEISRVDQVVQTNDPGANPPAPTPAPVP